MCLGGRELFWRMGLMLLGVVWLGLEDGDVEEILVVLGSRCCSFLGGWFLGEVMIVKFIFKGKLLCCDDGMIIWFVL